MIGIRGGIDKWGESETKSTHLNSIKDHMVPKEDVLDSDLDVDLSQFDHKSSTENFVNIANSNVFDDSPQIKHNPLAYIFNKSSKINTNLQKPANEIPSSNWTYKSQQSNSRLEQTTSADFLPSFSIKVPIEQSTNTKVNPLIGLSSVTQDETKMINNKPSSNWLLNPKHRLSQNNSTPSGHELIKNVSTQSPLGEDYSSYGNGHLNFYEENVKYNENYSAEHQDDNYEQNLDGNEYSNNYGKYRNHYEYEYDSEIFSGGDQDYNNTNGQYLFEGEDSVFSHSFNERSNYYVRSPNRDEYRDCTVNHSNYDYHDSVRIYRKTRKQRNKESTLGQIRMSLLNGGISDSSHDGDYKTSLQSVNYSCDEINSLPDFNSKYFQLSMTTIPPSGNSLPPLPEPDYDLSGATFYIPPPDY